MPDLRKLSNFELYYLKIKVTTGLFAELREYIDENRLIEAIKSTSQYYDFIMLRLSYSIEEPIYWRDTRRLPIIENIEGDYTLDEFADRLANEPLRGNQCSRFFVQNNKIGMIVCHAAVDGKVFTKLFLYLMSYLNNDKIDKDKLRINSNNSNISISELLFDTNSFIPPNIPSDVMKYINVPYIPMKGPSNQFYRTIKGSKYDKLESFINKVQGELSNNKIGITSTILTLINIAMNRCNKNEKYKSSVIDTIINLDKYLQNEDNSNNCYLFSISSVPLVIVNDGNLLESVKTNTNTLYNTVNSKIPLYYYNKMNENCLNTIESSNNMCRNYDRDSLDLELEYSSIGNYNFPSNINDNGLRLTQSCHGMMNILSVASIQDREKRFINFTFTCYAGAKIEEFIDIFCNLFDEL